MEEWEYFTEFMYANIENAGAEEFLQRTFPNWKNPPVYTPQTMIPHLNGMGKQGWELVHMEPVQIVGKKGDVGFGMGGSGTTHWSNVYFCVFKRRKQGAEAHNPT